ncbi:hypothetical protein R3W88_028736 [Solanum pinnatisectum]|uniref:Uncharacterized protein n=1 Tax=Solanum pinnatisectum TaxID=50273 RepID=A0AAV9K3R6_9SOLN|nr:hypothetical protein R3W88_028736 [Solanum pinnatisectum]
MLAIALRWFSGYEPIIFLADDSNLVFALHDKQIVVFSSFEVQPFNNVSYNNKNNITSVIPTSGI